MELCQHTATVRRYAELEGDDFIIVGGYESGVDAAYHLAHQGKRCKILDKGSPWKNEGSDPSVVLSTYSLERMRRWCSKNGWNCSRMRPSPVGKDGEGFMVETADGRRTPPQCLRSFGGLTAA